MTRISVLMSVYNEKREEIEASINSILSQSYENFELIIVLDNPEYTEGLKLLKDYAQKDKRICIVVNEKNIGLAMSMNRAAEHANGEYLLRMDADDVCMPNRFEIQLDAIENGDYDLICSNYDYIDEEGKLLADQAKVYSDKQLILLLPYKNIIHHPTVVMRSKRFKEIGGYRNYKCAQDYDLWLRMKCAGFKMHMLPQKLLKYRVRQASTTVQQRYKQSCTLEYIRMLYQEKNNMSSYSYDKYLEYLTEHNAEDKSANLDFIYYSNLYQEAKREIKKVNFYKGLACLFKVFFRSQYYRPHFLRSLKIVILSKIAKG